MRLNDVIIAVTNTYNDTVTMLPVVAELSTGNTATFHNNPIVDFNGKDIKRNFTFHFDFNLKGNRFHKELLPKHYFHLPRLKRMTQYLNIFHFNQEYRGIHQEIFIPEFYTATQREGEHVTMANFSLPQGDKVVIKETFGARGSNQVVVPTNMVTTLLKHTKGLTMNEVKVMFPDFIYSDGTTWDKVMFVKPSDLFISQLVPSVKAEWRLLVGGDKIYGRERMIKQGPYPQANLDHDVFVTVPEVKYEPIEEMFSDKLCKTLHAMVDFINLPIGSVDLFLTEDGRYGVFEYSTQFAFMGADNNFIRNILLDGLTKVITDNHGDIGKHLRCVSDEEDASETGTRVGIKFAPVWRGAQVVESIDESNVSTTNINIDDFNTDAMADHGSISILKRRDNAKMEDVLQRLGVLWRTVVSGVREETQLMYHSNGSLKSLPTEGHFDTSRENRQWQIKFYADDLTVTIFKWESDPVNAQPIITVSQWDDTPIKEIEKYPDLKPVMDEFYEEVRLLSMLLTVGKPDDMVVELVVTEDITKRT